MSWIVTSILVSLFALPSTLLAQVVSSEQLMQALLQTHALQDRETLRVVKPPFTKARQQWVQAELNSLGAEEEVRNVYFQWYKGTLRYLGADLQGAKAVRLNADRLGIPWHKIQGLEQVRWPTGPADVVIRAEASIEQKLIALAAFIEAETGQKLRITPQTISQPTIVLKGQTTSAGYPCQPIIAGDGFKSANAIFITSQPLEDATLVQWAERLRELGLAARPDGFYLFNWQGATQQLGAPLAEDATKDHGVWRGGGELADVVLLDKEILEWRPTDPDYPVKVAGVLKNLHRQLGGVWLLEDRETQVFTIEVQQ